MISSSFTARCDGHPIWSKLSDKVSPFVGVVDGYQDCDNTVTVDSRFSLSTPAGVAYAIAHLEARGWRVMLSPPDESMDYVSEDLKIGWERLECPNWDKEGL